MPYLSGMISRTLFLSLLVWSLQALFPAALAEENQELRCHMAALALAPADSPDARKYAPDRKMDIANLALDVTPDFKRRTIAAKATLTFKPIAKPLAEVELDAVDLAVESVESSEKLLGHHVTENTIVITFAEPIAPGKEATVTIRYSAEPEQGLYFRTPEMGYKEGDAHLFTQGEAILARHWYPCFDAPNEKFASEIICRVPEGMTVLSNGRLVSEKKDPDSSLTVVHWKQDKPHVNYLISLLAGHFKKIEDDYKGLPLAFYTPASQIDQAASSFRDTKDAMAFFEREIGVPYPWEKYYQVCVNDFVAGGMENTSITTLTDNTLFTDKSENIRSSQGLVAHELVHQWFGDLVTCKDWSHLWLNEGFATYYAHLYDGYKNGRDSMLYGLYDDARGITGRADDTKPIVYRKYDSPDEQFSYLAYPKGSLVLHMLRSQLGDDLYRRCIQTYLQRHQFDTVVTEDLNAVVEELSGRSYDRFFDQWVYHAHHPELEISYNWDERAKLAKLSVRQMQKISDDVLLFQFPLTIRFKGKAGAVTDRQITVKETSEDFYFPLTEAPKLVRVDPEFTLLAKVKFNLPDAMLHEQLADKSDVIGRLLAIEQLAGKKDGATIEKLKTALQEDPFYGVRLEAAQALRGIHTDQAFTALADSLRQPDARVRQRVASAVAGFYSPDAWDIVWQQLHREQNPDIVTGLIRGVAPYPKPEVRDALIRFLHSESYRNALADAAIGAMRDQGDPEYIEPLKKTLRQRESEFTSSGLGRALNALAYLARNEEQKDSVREFLLDFVNSRKRGVQTAAINALGSLGDPKAIPVLQTFQSAREGSREREAADRAITALRAAKRPSDEWRDLRTELLDLKKDNQDLKRQFDDLKKKVEAR
jgi:aminopeptidase N